MYANPGSRHDSWELQKTSSATSKAPRDECVRMCVSTSAHACSRFLGAFLSYVFLILVAGFGLISTDMDALPRVPQLQDETTGMSENTGGRGTYHSCNV